MPHQVETIPEEDKLFYHISVNIFNADFNFDDIPLHAFNPQGDGKLSLNWEKYCKTPQDCLSQKTERFPNGRTASTHGVGHFVASEIREIESLDVIHSPLPENRAHSSIINIPPKKHKAPYNEMRKN